MSEQSQETDSQSTPAAAAVDSIAPIENAVAPNGVTRRRFLRDGVLITGAALTGGAALFDAAPASAQTTPKRIYIAPDDHTDYMWSADEETYRQAFLAMTDYWLNRADATKNNPSDFQSRWNCDGSFWMWTYERNKSRADFEGRFIARLRDGHLSIPLTTLVGIYGGTPAEAILRGLYYAGRIERRYGLRFPLAVCMENQTLPFGLGALWAGAGAKYSWRGICGCGTSVPTAGNREHEIYWWTGQDGSKILMKWNSLYQQPAIDFNSASYKARYSGYIEPYGQALDANQNIGGYAEARYPYETVDFVDGNSAFIAKYPYRVIGAFGQGWDDPQTLSDTFVPAAQAKTNANRRVIVSNESDFFQDFAATYGATLPTQSVTFGNEWEIAISGLQEVSASVRRAVEKLRTAEALAALVSLKNPGFLTSRTVSVPITPGGGSYPPGTTSITDPTEARDLAFVNLGLYYEHDFGFHYALPLSARNDFNRRTAANIANYVDGLQADSLTALGKLIPNSSVNPRFFAFNPLGWTRTDFADFAYTGAVPVHVVDVATGQETPSQIVTVDGTPHLRVLASDMPPVGYKTFEIRSGAGAAFPPAASVSGATLENSAYRLGLTNYGAISSLIDKARGNREFARQVNGQWLNDLGASGGTIAVENSGPVSVTVKITAVGTTVPLDHVTRITLYANSRRIDLRNDIHENIQGTATWGFGFNFDAPTVWHEEVGAVIQAKLTTDGGQYSPRNSRYDWQSLGHFADIGAGGFGATLSNADCHFMKLGNSSVDALDTTTPLISPLAGGGDVNEVKDQDGNNYFLQRFALQTHDAFDPPTAMRFALEHQNPLTTGAVTGGSGYPEAQYSLLAVSNPNVLLWAVKPAEEGIGQGIIARVWNLAASPANFALTPTPTIAQAAQTTHIETDLQTLPVANNAVSASAAASQLLTFRLGVGAIAAGKVTFEGLVATAAPQSVAFTFRPSDNSGNVTQTLNVAADGNFALSGLPAKPGILHIKSAKRLAVNVPLDLTAGAVSGLTATLPAGDANNDNRVDVLDFGSLVNSYGSSQSDPNSGYDPTCDFNGDGRVDVLDFGLLVNNYGTQGDS